MGDVGCSQGYRVSLGLKLCVPINPARTSVYITKLVISAIAGCIVKILLLCEKYSQAQDIARGLGDNIRRRDMYMEGDIYIVCWAQGHLLTLSYPEQINPEWHAWTLDTLPIIPKQFRYVPIPSPDNRAQKMLSVIKSLVSRSDVAQVVICTDPGREGELIARLILRYVSCSKPLYRMWTTAALTPGAVRQAMEQLKDASEYEPLYLSALTRQQADWIVGINATRAWTKAQSEICTLGRVQTPTLTLVVEREKEIMSFKPSKYYEVQLEFACAQGKFEARWGRLNDDSGGYDHRIESREEAEEILARIKAVGAGVVEQMTEELKKEYPYSLFSLTSLQKAANSKLGFTAQETLDLAQSLYEKKVITYPRTEGCFLNQEMAPGCLQLLQHLTPNTMVPVRWQFKELVVTKYNKRVFDNFKVKEHHAIIPTMETADLTPNEKKLYELILRRFVAAFHGEHVYKSYWALIRIGEDVADTSGVINVEKGWRKIWTYDKGHPDGVCPLKRESVTLLSGAVDEKETKAPPRFTDSSLIDAMIHAARYADSQEYKEILEECDGIGTPATRSNIIEMLIRRGYLERRGRVLYPTDKAMEMVEILQEHKSQLTDVVYTAQWEAELEKIHQGDVSRRKTFMARIVKDTEDIVNHAKEYYRKRVASSGKTGDGVDKKSVFRRKVLGVCPNCGADVVEIEKGWVCTGDREKCGLAIWKDALSQFGARRIRERQALSLLMGERIYFRSLVSKSGKKFGAHAALQLHEVNGSKSWRVRLVFDEGKRRAAMQGK
mgnify:CR=1 FL=1